MHIAIIASGSRGDVQPYVALGKGLAQAGHVVRLVTHLDFETLANAHGLKFWPVAGNVKDVAQSAEMRKRLGKGNFLAVMRLMAKEAQRGALNLAEGGLAACQGVDLVLAGIGGLFIGLALAESLGFRCCRLTIFPLRPRAPIPAFCCPGSHPGSEVL